MLLRLALVSSLLASVVAAGQATSVEEPPEPSALQLFARPWAAALMLGDLRLTPVADSALELRFWTFGWGAKGLRLTRNEHGLWNAQRIVIENWRAVRLDTVPVPSTNAFDSMWQDLVAQGILTLPVHVTRAWRRADGTTYLVELRRGHLYRASRIEHLEKPEVPADRAIQRIALILQRRFP